MPIRELRVSGYRSLRQLRLPVTGLDVFVGPNGCGKSNLYRAMVLLAAAARGNLARAVAEEGGMPSLLWAGDRKRKAPVRVTLGVVRDDWEYEIACGLPIAYLAPNTGMPTAFDMDPLVKLESVTADVNGRRPVKLLDRRNQSAWLRDGDGRRCEYPIELIQSESALSQIMEAHLYPELAQFRSLLSAWRFYHQFRTDADSPMRQPQVGVYSPILDSGGENLAAVLQTIVESGDLTALDAAIDDAFPGSRLEVFVDRGRFEVGLTMPGVKRPFEARELSDGTLRYLCLVAALLSRHPAAFLVLNEPETSIHADLIQPLAHLIAKASERSQIWVITHSEVLAGHIEAETGRRPIRLEKVDGETRIVGQRVDGRLEDAED